MKKNILGVEIDDINLGEAAAQVEEWIKKGGHHYIVTPNPEFLVSAQNDPVFKKVLNKADLAIPDGVGLKLFGGLKNRLSGADLAEELVRLSAEKGYRIAFLGGKKEVAKKAAERLKQRYQNISVVFADDGGPVDREGNSGKIVIPKADLLLVGFGQVKQEKWIYRNLQDVPVKVVIGVGGVLDYWAGVVPRAPKPLRFLGLEWLFRLIIEPKRIVRQLSLLKYLRLLAK